MEEWININFLDICVNHANLNSFNFGYFIGTIQAFRLMGMLTSAQCSYLLTAAETVYEERLLNERM